MLLAPATRAEVAATPRATLRGAALLRGVRGSSGVDLEALADLVVAIGDLLTADPSIAEIDLNPVIAGPGGVVAVDALVVLEAAAGLTPRARIERRRGPAPAGG